jgi:ATP-dependent exoDNAse (exonuclease V) beta subunit
VMEKRFNETIKRRMKSDSFLLWGILQDRMRKFLEEEKRRDVKKILALEERIEGVMKLSKHEVTFGYTADRVDELRDDSIVIIDYKTGSSDVQPKSLSGLSKMELTRQNISESMKSFQLPIYYYFISRQFPGKQVNAQLYNIRTLDLLPFIRPAEAKQREEVMTVCLRALDFIFEEIINPEVDFVAVPDEQRCSYCSFKSACGI